MDGRRRHGLGWGARERRALVVDRGARAFGQRRPQRDRPRRSAEPGRHGLDFGLLGPLEVRQGDGRELPLGAGRQRALLAILLLHANETVSTDRLIDDLWGEGPPPTAAKVVQNHVAHLRRAIGNGCLVTSGHGYRLDLPPGSLDCERFKALVGDGRRALRAGDARPAAETLRRALALWRGPALQEFAYEDFAQGAIARLEELRMTAIEERIEADLALGLHAEVTPELEDLVREHPLRERLQGELMLALYRSGRQADALTAYGAARRRLVDELGLEPGAELQRLERAILNHDPALAPPPHLVEAPRARARPLVTRRRVLLTLAGVLGAAALAAGLVQLTRGDAPSPAVAANSVAVIDPGTNRVVGAVPIGSRPIALAFEAGSLWAANADDGTVSRIDPSSRQVVKTIGIGAPASDIAVGGGSVWVATGSEGRLVRIDPRTNTPLDPIDLSGPSKVTPHGAFAVAATPDAVWIASGSRRLVRVDLQSGRRTTVRLGQTPIAVAVGGGDLWVALVDGQTLRIEPKTMEKTGEVETPDGPFSIAASQATVWVGSISWPGVADLWRIDASTAGVEDSTRLPGPPKGIAVGGGAVWVACGDGTVARVDPRSGEITDRIPVGYLPLDVVYGDGLVWVSVGDEVT